MYRKLFLCLAWLIGSGFYALTDRKPTIFLVGDSTVATFAERYAPMAGWGQEFQSFCDYPQAVRQLATKLAVPLIDLHQRSFAHFGQLGQEATKRIFLWLSPNAEKNYPSGLRDNTHFSGYGAEEVGKLVIEGIKKLDLPLKDHLKGCRKETRETTTICAGDSVRVGKRFRTIAGEYRHTQSTSDGCPQTVITTLTVNATRFTEQSLSVAKGDSVWTGQQYRQQSGTYYDTLRSTLGCDSVVTTTLRVIPVVSAFTESHQSATLCAGDSLWVGGSYRRKGGTYYDTLMSALGCDSIVVTSLVVAEPVPAPAVVADGTTLRSSVSGKRHSVRFRW